MDSPSAPEQELRSTERALMKLCRSTQYLKSSTCLTRTMILLTSSFWSQVARAKWPGSYDAEERTNCLGYTLTTRQLSMTRATVSLSWGLFALLINLTRRSTSARFRPMVGNLTSLSLSVRRRTLKSFSSRCLSSQMKNTRNKKASRDFPRTWPKLSTHGEMAGACALTSRQWYSGMWSDRTSFLPRTFAKSKTTESYSC